MFENLVLVHQPTLQKTSGGGSFSPLFESDSIVRWNTCLREIQIGLLQDLGSVEASKEIYVGQKAYGFFLEVVCGLHSPIVGETEVMGQFKNLLEVTDLPSGPEGKIFRQFFQGILTDAKNVREKYLKGLGSRSYGSLVRKHIRDAKTVGLLGAGQLVQEILPWLDDSKTEFHIFCRRRSAGEALKTKHPELKIHAFNTRTLKDVEPDALIIAAPVSTVHIRDWIGATSIKRIIDLRHDSSSEPLKFEGKVLVLRELFDELALAEAKNTDRVAQAQKYIGELSQKPFKSVELRPFGWEDLCG
jgi:glutamyl-tRNA reductase